MITFARISACRAADVALEMLRRDASLLSPFAAAAAAIAESSDIFQVLPHMHMFLKKRPGLIEVLSRVRDCQVICFRPPRVRACGREAAK